jgi:hypothetical protein
MSIERAEYQEFRLILVMRGQAFNQAAIAVGII